MKTPNELITNDKPNSVISDNYQDITALESDLIDYLFHKIKLTWDQGKFWQTFNDEKTLEDTKRDWSKDLLLALNIVRQNSESEDEFAFRAKDKIDRIFSEIRILADDAQHKSWEWPSLKKIIAFMNKFVIQPSHRRYEPDYLGIESDDHKRKRQDAGKNALSNLKEMLK